LATTRAFAVETAESTLGELMGVDDAGEDECYAAIRRGAFWDTTGSP
jgi:hypothetical protein